MVDPYGLLPTVELSLLALVMTINRNDNIGKDFTLIWTLNCLNKVQLYSFYGNVIMIESLIDLYFNHTDVNTDNLFPVCRKDELETNEHIFITCDVAKSFQSTLGIIASGGNVEKPFQHLEWKEFFPYAVRNLAQLKP